MKIIVFEVSPDRSLEAFFIDTSLVDETNADQTAYRDIVMEAMNTEDKEGKITSDNCFVNENENLNGIRIDATASVFNENSEIVMLYIEG